MDVMTFFFVGVGPGLASEIVRNDSRDDLESGDLTVNELMFIRRSNENEIIETVKSFKSERSTDLNYYCYMFMFKVF